MLIFVSLQYRTIDISLTVITVISVIVVFLPNQTEFQSVHRENLQFRETIDRQT